MPELPEVQTTVNGLKKHVLNLTIKDVWTDYRSKFHRGQPNIKNEKFFKEFRASVKNKKIIKVSRRGKNVLIHLSGGLTIIIHMKMTGHLLYGQYRKQIKNKQLGHEGQINWRAVNAGPLRDDPYNQFIHLIFTLSNKRHLALSDLRKFAKVTLVPTDKLKEDPSLSKLGPEPLAKNFSFKIFRERLLRQGTGKIKPVLMNQNVIAGIGNIYSDEILWQANVHPLSRVEKIPLVYLKKIFTAMKKIINRSLKIGGASESDYRNLLGQPGRFQDETKSYAREGENCSKPNCQGIIQRIKINGRSACFCPRHQKIF
jgi:formamidopyrimidine-DNA glycosylase